MVNQPFNALIGLNEITISNQLRQKINTSLIHVRNIYKPADDL